MSAAEVNEDGELAEWILGIVECKPTPPGSFLASLAQTVLRADPENYALLRPALLAIRAKYPKYGGAKT